MGISEVNVNLSYSILAPSASNTDTYNQDINKCSKQLRQIALYNTDFYFSFGIIQKYSVIGSTAWMNH